MKCDTFCFRIFRNLFIYLCKYIILEYNEGKEQKNVTHFMLLVGTAKEKHKHIINFFLC